MANISKEEDERDFRERMANGGNRPHVLNDRPETREEILERTAAEVRAGLSQLRQLHDRWNKKRHK